MQILRDKAYDKEFSKKLIQAEPHFLNIFTECNNKFELGTGSYLFDGQSYEYCIEMYLKQKLLYDVSSKASKILEIGTYMGHSILIMLLANPKVKITCIDIDDTFSLPAIKYLRKEFPLSEIDFIKSDSLKTLPHLTDKFDFFHIDGAHLNDVIAKEFIYCLKLSKNKSFRMILDDIDSCLKVKKNINIAFPNSSFEMPNCNWRNCYVKIDFSSSKNSIQDQISKFEKLSTIDYLKEYPKNIIKKTRKFIKKLIKS